MTTDEIGMLRRLPLRIYSPTQGGGQQWASLIDGGFVSVRDVGDEQETILLLEATSKGRGAIATHTTSQRAEK